MNLAFLRCSAHVSDSRGVTAGSEILMLRFGANLGSADTNQLKRVSTQPTFGFETLACSLTGNRQWSRGIGAGNKFDSPLLSDAVLSCYECTDTAAWRRTRARGKFEKLELITADNGRGAPRSRKP